MLLGLTGLVGALSNDYLTTISQPHAIEWVCNHSLNTQIALYRGHIDLALTYERDREKQAVSEGWSRSAGCIFHDHFCLAGPVSDPAGVRSARTLTDALERIASSRALFHSRADGSATMVKERSLWAQCHLTPWSNSSADGWYKTSLHTPPEALKQADASGAYLLTDRSTLLQQTILETIHSTTVFFEPRNSDSPLMNSCYALYPSVQTSLADKSTASFIQYLLSERGQNIIGSFGVEQSGLPLFAPVSEGFAKTSLVKGRPRRGKWVQLESL